MPCRYDSPEQELSQANSQLDELTAMLCLACGALERKGLLAELPAKVESWWIEHKKADSRRELAAERERTEAAKRDAVRRSALAKLTADERRSLGV